jgi:hypothetical protein
VQGYFSAVVIGRLARMAGRPSHAPVQHRARRSDVVTAGILTARHHQQPPMLRGGRQKHTLGFRVLLPSL